MSARVLLVEDEPSLARGLTDNFRDEGYEVEHVARGDQALDAVRRSRPDLVVLDLTLPGRPGLDVLRELRARGDDVPVLVLTAKGDVVDRVVGFELGADDYLPKPFAVRELLARMAALLRRSRRGPGSEVRIGSLTFDLRALTASAASAGSTGVELTTRDLLVLRALVDRRGEVVTRTDVVEEVAGLDSEVTLRTVDNHVMALRRALGDDPRRPRYLQTVRGVGYRLALED